MWVDAQATAQKTHFNFDNDDSPLTANVPRIWGNALQAAIIGIFILIFLFAIAEARTILVPITSAFVVGMMLGSLSVRASDYGIPVLITAIALWLLVVVVFYGVIALLSALALDWIGRASEIGSGLEQKLHSLDQSLTSFQYLRSFVLFSGGNAGFGLDVTNFVKSMVTVVTPAVGQIFIFFATLFFFLLGRAQLRRIFVAAFNQRETRLRVLRILNDIERNLTTYLTVVTMINSVVGLAAGSIAYFVGLPNAIAWGVLAFALNFIPYIGALIVEAALLAMGLVMFATLGHALLAPLLFLGISTLEGQFITPSIMGQRLTLAPLTVFLSLVFWAWMWGPMGAFLAVPLIIATVVVTEHALADDDLVLPG